MAKIEIPAFTGLNLRAAPHLLKPGEATNAHDCVLDSGAIVPLRDATGVADTVPVGTKSLYYWNGAGAWVSATTDRWYAEAGQYLYWADGGVPQKQRVGGSAVRLGIEDKDFIPSLTIEHSSYSEGFKGLTNLSFLVTFYSDPLLGGHGGESVPMPAGSENRDKGMRLLYPLNATVTTVELRVPGGTLGPGLPKPGAVLIDDEVIYYTDYTYVTQGYGYIYKVTLSGVTRGISGSVAEHPAGSLVLQPVQSVSVGLPTSNDSQVTSRRLYQLIGEEYRLVHEEKNNSANSVTLYYQPDPGAILTADNNDPPPNLTGIVGPHNGMLFGWLGKALRWTKVGNFDAWPEEYTFDDFPADITACALWGGFLVVFTPEGVYTVSGSDPENLHRTKVQGTAGCIAPRSVVNIGRGLLYVSQSGVYLFDGLSSRSLSYDKLGERVVLANPRSAFWRGRAHIFHDGADLNGKVLSAGCLICDLRTGDPVWTTSGITTPFPYVLPLADKMYLVSGTDLVQWESGSARTWSYSTGLLDAQDDREGKLYSVLRLDAEGAVTATPKVNGAAIGSPAFTVSTSGTRALHRKRLPPERGERFSLDLGGTGSLHGLTLEYQ